MKVRVGQQWECHRASEPGNPLVLEVLEVLESTCVIRSFVRSDPGTELERSTMWIRDLKDTGVLARGPGSEADKVKREARIAEALDLLAYAARREGEPAGPDQVRVAVAPLVEIVAEGLNGDADLARSTLREALAALGGTESWTYGWRDHSYVERAVFLVPLADRSYT